MITGTIGAMPARSAQQRVISSNGRIMASIGRRAFRDCRAIHNFRALVVVLCGITWLMGCNDRLFGQPSTGRGGMVATVNPIATEAGLAALKAGGNAVDAAVAAALTLGVVDGHNSGLGGGCFILIRTASGDLVAIDGRETAPAAATRDMYVRDGVVVPELSRTGPLAVGVPGALAAYQESISQFGQLDLSGLLNRAAEIADQGFAVDRVLAKRLDVVKPAISKFPASRRMLLKPDGSSYRAGETLRLPDLARSYRNIANLGTDWFYRGPYAKQVSDWMKANGGLLTAEDFAGYRCKRRQPVVSAYRGYQIVGFPPPSSGGVHVAQILNILEHFQMRDLLRDDSAAAHHVIAEAMKLAFADRAYWLGDSDFAQVPRGLIDRNYAAQLAKRIDLQQATAVPSHGLPPDRTTNVFGKHTTHIAAADRQGNWVAITATINTSFGSKVVVPGTGIVLNNEMDDFSARPGQPNAFGLVGAEANAIAPGKRPLSSMSPTIVLQDDSPVLTVGGAGGPRIITAVLLAIVRYLDAQQPLDQCIADPRFHHQWRPDQLYVEETFDRQLTESLSHRGHSIKVQSSDGIAQAIARSTSGQLIGVADPRVPGLAASWDSDR